MDMSPPGYDPEADFAATGKALCNDCGTRVKLRTIASLPDHGCVTVQQANRYLLAMVVQRRVFRDLTGGVQVWNVDGPQPVAEQADYAAFTRLVLAELITIPEPEEREPYYDITDRALQGA